jgi:signal-transduction protein with cAMP-binding, CBS, and nucleotidyltransferase domain
MSRGLDRAQCGGTASAYVWISGRQGSAMHILDICTRETVTCRRNASALDVARLMRQRHVGDVIVVDDTEGCTAPVGVVTDRDLVVHVLAAGVDPESVTASDIMSDNPATALGSEAIFDAIWHMRGHGIRRLPIVDRRGALIGVVTADDVTRFLATELGEVARIAPQQTEREHAALAP